MKGGRGGKGTAPNDLLIALFALLVPMQRYSTSMRGKDRAGQSIRVITSRAFLPHFNLRVAECWRNGRFTSSHRNKEEQLLCTDGCRGHIAT